MLDKGWLFENIHREVGSGSLTLFWRDSLVDGFPLYIRFRQLYDLAQCKLVTARLICNSLSRFAKVLYASILFNLED